MMKIKSGLTSRQIVLAEIAVFILAGIHQVCFRWTDSGMTESVLSQLCTDLQMVRSQINLYRIQHNDKLPGTTEGVSFVEAMTLKTNADGSLATNPDGSILKKGGFGPYLKQIPVNGFTRINNAVMHYVMRFTRDYDGLNTVEIDGNPGGGDYGWHYDSTTGAFHADDDAHVRL